MGPGCCDESCSALRTVNTELRIHRDGVQVWRGIDHSHRVTTSMQVSIFAEDMLWVAKRRAVETGFELRAADRQLNVRLSWSAPAGLLHRAVLRQVRRLTGAWRTRSSRISP